MKYESYWLDTAPTFQGGAEGDVVSRADVAVIGGGLTGLSTALALAKRGASVVLLEAAGVVGEASGRNGGQCNTGTLQDYRSLVQSAGAARADAYYRAFTAAVDTVERVAKEEQIDCDFHRCGKLKLAAKPKHFDNMIKSYEALKANIDPNVSLVPPEQLQGEIRSDAFYGGLLQATSAQLHVGKFGVGLAEAAARQGVLIYENAAVSDLKRVADGWRVTSARGSVQAAQVMVATGGANPGPFGWFRRRIVPVGSFIVVSEPVDPAVLDSLMPTRRSYVTSLNIGNYFRVTPDSRLLFGGRARFAVSGPKTDRTSGEILRAGMQGVFPQLKDAGIDYCWGGSVDMSQDRLPHAGQHKGIFYSMGYSGHGVQMAVHMGQIMADVMAGKEENNLWGHKRWAAIPGHFGPPWFLPLVGAYYRLQDILH